MSCCPPHRERAPSADLFRGGGIQLLAGFVSRLSSQHLLTARELHGSRRKFFSCCGINFKFHIFCGFSVLCLAPKIASHHQQRKTPKNRKMTEYEKQNSLLINLMMPFVSPDLPTIYPENGTGCTLHYNGKPRCSRKR